MNVDRDGKLDGRTLHAGRPVEHGAKVGLNVWLRQRPRVAAAVEAADDAAPPAKRAAGSGWRPLRPPPKQTQASPAAQNSDAKRERF